MRLKSSITLFTSPSNCLNSSMQPMAVTSQYETVTSKTKKPLKPLSSHSSHFFLSSSPPVPSNSQKSSQKYSQRPSLGKRKDPIELSSDPIEESDSRPLPRAKKRKSSSNTPKSSAVASQFTIPSSHNQSDVTMESKAASQAAPSDLEMLPPNAKDDVKPSFFNNTGPKDMLDFDDDEEAAFQSAHNDLASSSKITLEAIQQMEQGAAPEQKPVVLSEEQQRIMRLVQSGKSVFFTGSAGVGKSILLREIIANLKQKFGSQAVAVTASTGLASTNITGCTLHSFAGLGLAKEKKETLVSRLFAKHNAKSRMRWQRTKVLVIDEISMVDGRFFDKLEFVARQVRGQPTLPFGGIQLVVCGDFFQLPPVPDNGVSCFAFKGNSWKECFPQVYSLKTVFRQSDDRFVRVLNEMRLGTVSDEAIAIFQSLERSVEYTDGIEPTHLLSKRDEVKSVNMSKLTALKTEERVFESIDVACKPKTLNKKPLSLEDAVKRLDRDTLAESSIALKVGAQVMCIKNLPDVGLVNGSLGQIMDFKTEAEVSAHNAIPGSPLIGIAKLDTGDKQKRIDFEVEHRSTPETEDADQSEASGGCGISEGAWPVVKFALPGGGHKWLLMPQVGFSVTDADGTDEAVRSQTPLVLAWALTIHKAQGQTLHRVKVNLASVFEKGQAYVAISRAVSLDHLEVRGFAPSKVMAHPYVLSWAKTLV